MCDGACAVRTPPSTVASIAPRQRYWAGAHKECDYLDDKFSSFGHPLITEPPSTLTNSY